MDSTSTRVSALAIGGLDPTGTAGLATDLRTLAAFEVHGLVVATVVTAQTTSEFRLGSPVGSDVVSAQLDALLDDIEPLATKVAMLWSAPTAEAVATACESGGLGNVVIDPVLADGEGNRIVDRAVDDVYRRLLIPAASVVTPNWVEAGYLLERGIDSLDAAIDAATDILDLGVGSVVLTGGGWSAGARRSDSGSANEVVDVVATPAGVSLVKHARLTESNVRGSGDTLSAAITAGLALGAEIGAAIEVAEDFTQQSIERGLADRLGFGRPSVHPPSRR